METPFGCTCIKMYKDANATKYSLDIVFVMCVALPTHMGAWSMAGQPFEYYYYYCLDILCKEPLNQTE